MGNRNQLEEQLENWPDRHSDPTLTPAVNRSIVSVALSAMMALALAAGIGWSQDTVWTRRFDTGWWEWLLAGAVDRNGNPYALGEWYNNPDFEDPVILVVKYNSEGETLWSRKHDGPYDDWAGDVTIDARGDVIVAGSYFHQGAGDAGVTLVKYDADGNPLWVSHPFQSDDVIMCAVTTDDSLNIYAAGYSSAVVPPSFDALVLKCLADGNLAWVRTFDLGGDVDIVNSLILDEAGRLIGTGSTGGFLPNGSDLLTIVFNGNGDTIWSRRLDFAWSDWGAAVVQSSAGDLVIAGSTAPDLVTSQCLVVKCDTTGETLWTRQYRPGDCSYGTDIILDRAGDLLIAGGAGDTGSAAITKSSCLLMKCNRGGDTLWTRRYQLDYCSDGAALALGGSNALYVFGTTYDQEFTNSDMFVIKLHYEAGIEEPEVVGAPGRPADAAGPTLLGRGEALRLAVTAAGDYRVFLSDAAGRTIRVLYSGRLDPGEHTFSLAAIPAGVYFCRAESGPTRLSRKVVLTTGNR